MPLVNDHTTPARLRIDLVFDLARMDKGPTIIFTCFSMKDAVLGHELVSVRNGCTYCQSLVIDRAVVTFIRHDADWQFTRMAIRQTDRAVQEHCPHQGGTHY